MQMASTDISVMLDSDAAPCPGWIEAMVKPFDNAQVQAVAGSTVLGHDNLLSRTMALSWIMKLPSERDLPVKHRKMYANNCAFRTDFFRQNPFPDLQAFKKACGFWQRDIEKRGIKIDFAPDAMTVHAPHPGGTFLIWRAWTTGLDRDFKTYHRLTRSRSAGSVIPSSPGERKSFGAGRVFLPREVRWTFPYGNALLQCSLRLVFSRSCSWVNYGRQQLSGMRPWFPQ